MRQEHRPTLGLLIRKTQTDRADHAECEARAQKDEETRRMEERGREREGKCLASQMGG